MVHGSHDPVLVSLSVLIAIAASYTALDLIGQTRTLKSRWYLAAATVLGGGIWSMHFIGMLAYKLPFEVSYDPGITALSLALPIIVTGAGFKAVERYGPSWASIIGGGVFMGLGIVSMHYTGMAAMRSPAQLHFQVFWVAVSVAIALAAASTALWLTFQRIGTPAKLLAATVMGVAIAGMHYSAMQAAHFVTHIVPGVTTAGFGQDRLALVVALAAFGLFTVALTAASAQRQRVEAALRVAEMASARLASMTSAAPYAAIALSLDGRITAWNTAAERLFGYSPDEAVGKLKSMIYPSNGAEEAHNLLKRVRSGETVEVDTQRCRKDQQLLDVNIAGAPIRNPAGEIVGMTFLISDITARKKAEQRINDLMTEVNHRSKNLLAIVQSIARNTLGRYDPDVVKAFDDRLMALAANQDLLVSNDWKGVDLEALVRGQLALVSDLFGTRIIIMGPATQLSAQAAQGIGLALHELATNAIKYGSLSNKTGTISISWSIDELFIMRWEERGGPPVSAPTSKGFGTTVITRMAGATVGGTVSVGYESGGFSWALTAPVEQTLDLRASSAPRAELVTA